jgi:hypothetical protein
MAFSPSDFTLQNQPMTVFSELTSLLFASAAGRRAVLTVAALAFFKAAAPVHEDDPLN